MATLEDVKQQVNAYIREYDLFGKVVENVYKSSPLSVILRRNKRTVKGIEHEFRLRLNKSTIPTQRARYYDELFAERIGNPVKGVVRLGILQKVASISQDEIKAVDGEAKVIDIVIDKLRELEESFKEAYTNDLIFGSGTGNEPIGLDAWCTAGNNIAGINETDYPNWSPVFIDGNTYSVFGTLPNSDTNLLSKVSGSDVRVFDAFLNRVFEDIKKGEDELKPDLIVMTDHLYGLYKMSVFPQVMLRDEDLVDIGFDNVKFGGTTIISDPFIPNRTMYVLNTKYIEFLVSKDMEISDFEPVSRLQRVLVAIAEAEFTILMTSRRRQAKCVNIGS